MSNLVDINTLLKLKNFSKKYGISLRKIYRYIEDNSIEYVTIDGIDFLFDREYDELKTDHRCKNTQSIVKIVTIRQDNDKILTIDDSENGLDDTLNTENDNVKTVTKGNDKILTKEEQQLIDTPDIKLSGQNLMKKYKLLGK